MNFPEGRPAAHFDTFPIALLTVFQVKYFDTFPIALLTVFQVKYCDIFPIALLTVFQVKYFDIFPIALFYPIVNNSSVIFVDVSFIGG
jgi:hypothetical protein